MTDWQPIETAPKDGTRILLHLRQDEEGDYVRIGYWGKWNGHLSTWCLAEGDGDDNPTHWQPLPERPAPVFQPGDTITWSDGER